MSAFIRTRFINSSNRINLMACKPSSRSFCSLMSNSAAFQRRIDGISRQSFPRKTSPISARTVVADQRQLKLSSSSLYTPPEEGESVPFVLKPELDFDAIIKNQEQYEESVSVRRMTGIDIPKMVTLWQETKRLEIEKAQVEKERKTLNSRAKELSKQKGENIKEKDEIQLEGRRIREAVKKVNSNLNDVVASLYPIALSLPNVLHKDVPRSEENRVIEAIGNPEENSASSSFLQEDKRISADHPLVHPGYGYTKGELVLKELELISDLSSQLESRGFTQLSMPDMFKPIALEALGISPEESKETYTIETSENLMYLAGTSPMGFFAYYMMSVLEPSDLPQRCFAVGRHYDASAESSTFQGIHRQFQDSTVQLFGVCEGTQNASSALLAQYVQLLKESLSTYDIPLRTVDVSSTRLLPSVHRMVAIELWLPKKGKYVEVTNVCNCTDYVSRRLKIRNPTNPRESAKQSRDRSYVHTIHGTALRTSVLLSSLLQHGKFNTER